MLTTGPIKGDISLHEEVTSDEFSGCEVEEYYTKEEIMENKRKAEYARRIMGELEAYTQNESHEWQREEEDKLWDLLCLIDNIIKNQLSQNIPNYME